MKKTVFRIELSVPKKQKKYIIFGKKGFVIHAKIVYLTLFNVSEKIRFWFLTDDNLEDQIAQKIKKVLKTRINNVKETIINNLTEHDTND